MSRRHDSLIPLTHDHHHALAQMRNLRMAAGGEAKDVLQQSKEFLAFFREDTLNHFREEEEIVFPLAIGDQRASKLVSRAVTEHIQIHALVAQLAIEVGEGRVRGSTALGLAEALEAHIRFEEREIFPLLEEVVSDAQLRRMALTPRNRDAA